MRVFCGAGGAHAQLVDRNATGGVCGHGADCDRAHDRSDRHLLGACDGQRTAPGQHDHRCAHVCVARGLHGVAVCVRGGVGGELLVAG